MTIEKLEEFASNGDKHLTGLDVATGFPRADKPERPWFNKLFGDITGKINEVVDSIDGLPPFDNGVLADTFVAISSISAGGVSRDLRDKLRDSISVLDFGADPTGTIDAKAAFRAANAYATMKGYSLDVPYGVYEFKNDDKVDITCNIRGSGEIRGSLRLLGDNLTLSGIEVSGGYNPATGAVGHNGRLFVTGRGNTVFNCHVHHTNGIAGIAVYGGSDTKVIGCNVHDCYGVFGDGIAFFRGENNTAAFNTVKKVQRCAIVADTDAIASGVISHSVNFSNNFVDNTGAPDAIEGELGAGIWCEHVANSIITNNIIRNFSKRGIVINPQTQQNTEMYIDGTHSNFVDNNDIYSSDTRCIGIATAGVDDNCTINITNCSLRGKFAAGITANASKATLISDVSFRGEFALKIGVYAGEGVGERITNVVLRNLSKTPIKYSVVSTAQPADITLGGSGHCNVTVESLQGEWEIQHPEQEFLGAFKAHNSTLRFSVQQSESNPQVYLSTFTESYYNNCTLNFHHANVRSVGNLNISACALNSYISGGTAISIAYSSKYLKVQNSSLNSIRFRLSQVDDGAVMLFRSVDFKDYGDFAISACVF